MTLAPIAADVERIACTLPWFKAVTEIQRLNGGRLTAAGSLARSFVSRNPDSILSKSYFELDVDSPSRRFFR